MLNVILSMSYGVVSSLFLLESLSEDLFLRIYFGFIGELI